MNDDEVLQCFFDEICSVFPEIKPLMDMQNEFMITAKMEVFADATCIAFADGNISLAKNYLSYINNKLIDAHPIEFEYIDVYYVEHLFWKANDDTKAIGWPLVPPKLQKLYVDFHGSTAI
jgi:hypothetical protein